MRTLLIAILMFSSNVFAQSVLDPGPGTDYMVQWCGGQTVNEYAEGFDSAGMPTTIVRVQTICNGSGRGSRSTYYFSCSRVTFDWTGAKINQEFINSGSWLRGRAYIPCDAVTDPLATFDYVDANGNVTGTLSTGLFPSGYRATLQ